MNLEYCDITSELLEEQDIIERLNETDDFICLSGIINDSISDISEKVEDTLLFLKYQVIAKLAMLVRNLELNEEEFVQSTNSKIRSG